MTQHHLPEMTKQTHYTTGKWQWIFSLISFCLHLGKIFFIIAPQIKYLTQFIVAQEQQQSLILTGLKIKI